MNEIVAFIMNSPETALGAFVGVIVLLLVLVMVLFVRLSSLRSLYEKMMVGEESGQSMEKMLLNHIEETRRVAEENAKLREENARIDALLKTAITRVGVVRFSAFQDMGSDLSYAVAMLDAFNNGVVFSSIFAREDSRSYVKPIDNGKSMYTLTKEEEQALKNAIGSAK
ncbi:MAG: DUF4446 family protein [Schwartzia sp.]|nr:DUF4446 family protein [Schwartzia sp. (in: firmicutes)]MBO6235827.1 DUF4446 family protein [Schwartzia sp. (in: firmicutes)]MBP3691191.1 DUF4446 family protein [Schwartzia sp. (in: firmicutes)]